MLVGRAEVLARVDWLISGARAGRGGALLLLGEPGAGKSALLDAALALGGGMTVLRCRGAQDERELPYAGLHALLRPSRAEIESLVPAQRGALEHALGRADGTPSAPLVVAAALLSVLDAATADGPVLVLVDDLQWLDAESRDALAFAARRVEDSPVALVLAGRSDGPVPDGLERLALDDLAPADAVLLLQRQGLGRSVAETITRVVGGNPLALLESASGLDPGQRSGAAPLPDRLPPTGPGAVYAATLAMLPEDVRRAAGVAAVVGTASAAVLADALGRCGLDHDQLAAAESTGLLTVSGTRVSWRHPLAQAAARDAMAPDARRTAHGAVAEALAASGGDPAAVAWHRADAAHAPDDALAAGLEGVAEVNASRGAHLGAARAWEAAADLGTSADDRARRLGQAGLEAWLGGDPGAARRLIPMALPQVIDPDLRWQLVWTAAQVAGATGSPTETSEAYAAAVAEARDQGRTDREVHALASAFNSTLHRDDPTLVEALVGDLVSAADVDDPVQAARSHAVQGFAALLADATTSGRDHLAQAMTLIEEHHLLEQEPDLLPHAVQCVMWSGQPQRMRTEIEATIARLKAAGDMRTLTATARGLAWCDYAGASWDSAALLADEGLDLARIAGRPGDVCDSLVQVAALEGVRGHTADAVRHAREARDLARTLEDESREVEALWAEVLTGLSAQDLEELAPPTALLAGRLAEMAHPANQPEYFDVPLALAVLGREGRARELLQLLLDDVGEDVRPESRVGEVLCRAHLGPDSMALAELAAALADSLVDDEYVFGRARLRLVAGSITRRLGQRVEARALLRAAESDFAHLGAAPWLNRTQDELRSSGATLRRAAEPESALTAAEARVARAAAGGMSNKEIAAALFLSPKTVEFHLGRVYRKLAVRTRAELVLAVLEGPYAPPVRAD